MSFVELDDFTDLVNAHLGGFNEHLGLVFTKATVDAVEAEVEIGPQHHQPYGLVHGGVYTTMVETLASTGAALNAMPQGLTTVGLDNNTSFLKAVRSGTLYGRALPLAKGRRTHVWAVQITDDRDRLVAEGRVRLLCLEQGTALAGEAVSLKTQDLEPVIGDSD